MSARLDAIEAAYAPISTAKALREAPVGIVVTDGAGDVLRLADRTVQGWWYTTGDEMAYDETEVVPTAIVLSHPDHPEPVPALVDALRAVLAEADACDSLAAQAEGLSFDSRQKSRAVSYRLAARGIRAAITAALDAS